eukprot:Gb_40296 [translate_table: standard]
MDLGKTLALLSLIATNRPSVLLPPIVDVEPYVKVRSISANPDHKDTKGREATTRIVLQQAKERMPKNHHLGLGRVCRKLFFELPSPNGPKVTLIVFPPSVIPSWRTLARFHEGWFNVLIAMDVVSRGPDNPNVDLVIHCELPNISKIFVHRVGHIGHVVTKGNAILIYTEQWLRQVKVIEQDVGCKFTELPKIAKDIAGDRFGDSRGSCFRSYGGGRSRFSDFGGNSTSQNNQFDKSSGGSSSRKRFWNHLWKLSEHLVTLLIYFNDLGDVRFVVLDESDHMLDHKLKRTIDSVVRRLDIENAEVSAKVEVSKLRATKYVATCQEVSKREKKSLKQSKYHGDARRKTRKDW